MAQQFPRIDQPELFFGFVAPIGADINDTLDSFEKYLNLRGYKVERIKVTDFYKVLSDIFIPDSDLNETSLFERYSSYIEYGNQLRKNFKDNSVLAITSILQIVQRRQENIEKGRPSYEKTAYLIHQFKRKEEIEILRSVYGRLFFQVSVYSRKGARVTHLANLFESKYAHHKQQSFRAMAEELVKRDEKESGTIFGQNVSDIFHDADFIVNIDLANHPIADQVTRFCELIFGANFISPNKDEFGLFFAKTAALRSLDLSRQVGAAIFTPDGEVISVGCNEVPKAFGGPYWCDEIVDDRDYIRGYDPNDQRKEELLSEVIEKIAPNLPNHERDLRLKEMSNTRFMDALEYGRIIHAEMAAITEAARMGRALRASVLFCTTFPCHLCAKHIVASGVRKVVFLEPYPKSLAEHLHSDSISIESGDRGKYVQYPSTEFIHFFGVTPRRFRELFEGGKRKKDGIFVKYKGGTPRPIMNFIYPFYAALEEELIKEDGDFFTKLDTQIKSIKIKSRAQGKQKRVRRAPKKKRL